MGELAADLKQKTLRDQVRPAGFLLLKGQNYLILASL